MGFRVPFFHLRSFAVYFDQLVCGQLPSPWGEFWA
jgi:hypothetical protein